MRALVPSFLRALLCALIVSFGSIASAAETLSYKLVSPPQKVPYGGPIEYPNLLDTFDVDQDGADDFAISAKTRITNRKDYSKNKFIHSLFVHNDPRKKTFRFTDFGEAGVTQTTWAGKFFKMAPNGTVYLALARGEELGFYQKLAGALPSIFELTPSGNSVAVETVFVGTRRGNGAGVSICDIDRDGTEEIFSTTACRLTRSP
jgi:hypothetical protein